jgi:beta-phosphoglucomutase-like phosphatase (HAD superfamily)
VPKTGIIFDCDGTLLDTIPVWKDLELYLAGMAGGEVTREDLALLTTYTIPETADWFHDQLGLGESGEAVLRLMDEYLLGRYQTARALPGVADFLERCAEAGFVMSVASSSPVNYLEAGLRSAGILQHFSAVCSVEDLNSSKREPKVYDHARELMGTELARTWGVEDSLYAMKTLANAGYRVVGIYEPEKDGPIEPLQAVAEHVVRSLGELSVCDLR